MASRGETFICYWGGRMINDNTVGLCYDSEPKRQIRLTHDSSYSQLLTKCYKVMGLDMSQFTLKITCRWPGDTSSGGATKYLPLIIGDDDDLMGMFDLILDRTGFPSLSLYLEAFPLIQMVDEVQTSIPQPSLNRNRPSEEFMLPYTEQGTQVTVGPSPPVSQPESFSPVYDTAPLGDEVLGEMPLYTLPSRCSNDLTENPLVNGVQGRIDCETDPEDAELPDCTPDGSEDEAEQTHVPSDADGRSLHSYIPMTQFMTHEEFGDELDTRSSFPPVHANLWNPTMNELGVGLRFHTKEDLKAAVIHFSVNDHHEYDVVESSPITWVVKCSLRGQSQCKWRLRARKLQGHGMFEITKYEGPHTCLSPTMRTDHKQLNASYIANSVQCLVKADPSVKVSVIIATIRKDNHYSISYTKAWNAKKKALAQQFGDWDLSYKELPKFLRAIQEYNPGTIVDLQVFPHTEDSVVFNRVFWNFRASKEGFRHCRPVVSIDVTHLYGKYSGKMLIAMSLDANNQVFPLAFAIVSEEDQYNWEWFLENLCEHVLQGRKDVCLISDRHSGIIAAVKSQKRLYGFWKGDYGRHRFCLRHVRSNFCEQFKGGGLKRLVWIAGSTPQVRKFDKVMDQIKEINEDAFKYLDKIPAEMWALSHDKGYRFGQTTTNISEVFNGVIRGARSVPISASVEFIFYKLAHYFMVRRLNGQKAIEEGVTQVPLVANYIAKRNSKVLSHNCQIFNYQTGHVSVHTAQGNAYVVNRQLGKCSCGKWELFGMPCSHVMAACTKLGVEYMSLFHSSYTLASYCQTYAAEIYALDHIDYWPQCTSLELLPNSELRRSVGRPVNSRRKNEMDQVERRQKNCGHCKQPGHDKRRCPEIPTRSRVNARSN